MRNKKTLTTFILMVAALAVSACGGQPDTPTDTSEEIPEAELDAYVANLKETSVANHFYYHYLRGEQTNADFNQLDVWLFPYKPNGGEGVKFDWKGRTQGTDDLRTATGNPTIDNFGYVHIDVDLGKKYDGGWDAAAKKMGGTEVDFLQGGEPLENIQLGAQIVYTSTRISASGFWSNDGGDVHLKLKDYGLKNNDGSTSYHAFVYEDNVARPSRLPVANKNTLPNPFKGDDGKNVTFKNDKYSNVDWATQADIADTAQSFLKNAGVGYQIMVSSFADSDGDRNGDIYGIELKIPYLKKLGVKVLWLTPIQLSDSYHGYDISDYLLVDPKFGSKESPAAKAHNGVVDELTALEDYKSLLATAHENDMMVIMDLVLNHTAVTNNWFIDSAKLNPAYRGYYQWGNNQTQADDINTDKFWYPYGSHYYSYYAKFGSAMPELNYAYLDTRKAMYAVADFWADLGVDGFRMDAVKHIFLNDEIAADDDDTVILDISDKEVNGVTVQQDYSSNLTKNIHFWRDLNDHVKARHPDCFFVGENFDGHAYHVAPFYEGFDSLFDFYSYFNLTSIASYYYNSKHGIETGEYSAKAAKYVGHNPSDYYDVDKDSDAVGKPETSLKYESSWSQKGVFETNNKYRTGGNGPSDTKGYSMINGVFTSNHDISRAVNRVGGKIYNRDGLKEQGFVTSQNYEELLRYATLVEINELMLPGLTWIYYGDELGMTGNFKDAEATSLSDYSDLCYRQPMKWVQDGKVGDGSMTTGQSITGSKQDLKWDDINASTLVEGANAQMDKEDSHYGLISKFANYKNSHEALIRGNFTPFYGDIQQEAQNSVVSFKRTLGGNDYRVVVNYGEYPVGLSNTGTIILSYGTVSANSVGGMSAVLYLLDGSGDIPTDDGFGLIFDNGTKVKATYTSPYEGFEQYLISGYEFKEGDDFKLYDFKNDASWVVNINPASLDGKYAKYLSIVDGKYHVKLDFKGDVYIKIKQNQDEIYFGFAS